MLKIVFGLAREVIAEKVQGCQPNKMINHVLKLMKTILTVAMVTKLFVVMRYIYQTCQNQQYINL